MNIIFKATPYLNNKFSFVTKPEHGFNEALNNFNVSAKLDLPAIKYRCGISRIFPNYYAYWFI